MKLNHDKTDAQRTFLPADSLGFGMYIVDHGTAETNRPTVVSISKKDSFKWVFGTTSLSGPMYAAVICVDNCAFSSDGPTFKRIQKLHIK